MLSAIKSVVKLAVQASCYQPNPALERTDNGGADGVLLNKGGAVVGRSAKTLGVNGAED